MEIGTLVPFSSKLLFKASEFDQEIRVRGLINHVWSNDLGAEWIDHHSYYSYHSLS
jgi:hypothetical protein